MRRKTWAFGRGGLFVLVIGLLLLAAEGLRAERWESRAVGPERRTGNTAVWTGEEMIIWGGGRKSQWMGGGARYNLAGGFWTQISMVNSQTGRSCLVSVWSGVQ